MIKKTITDLTLEKYLLGELSAKQRKEVTAWIAADVSVSFRIAQLQKSNESFSTNYPFHELKNKLGIKPESKKKRVAPWIFSGAGVAFAALLLTFNFWNQEPKESTTIKGLSPSLSVYFHVGPEVRKISPNERIPKGAEIQLSYTAATKKYGVVVSIDSSGNLTWHLPDRPAKMVRLNQEGETALPIAFALDDSPNFEKFIMLTADSEADLKPYLAGWKVSNAKTGETFWEHPLPPQVQIYEFILRK